MARPLSDSVITTLSRAFVAILLAVSLVAAFFAVREGGIAALPPLLPGVLLTLIVAALVFTDSFDSPAGQVAFGLAMLVFVVFGPVESTVVSALLAAATAALIAATLHRMVSA